MLNIKLIPLLIMLVILAALGGIVYGKANALTNIEYVGIFNRESTFIDELLGKDIIYTFTANTGEVFTLSFGVSNLLRDTEYKLVFEPLPFWDMIRHNLFTRKADSHRKHINGHWYMLNSIVKLAGGVQDE